MRLAMSRLECVCATDEFADQLLVTVGEDREERLEDQVANRLWFKVEENSVSARPGALPHLPRRHGSAKRFHPVRDTSSALRWDGPSSVLNSWLFRLRRVSRPRMAIRQIRVGVAGHPRRGVRRIRQPGAKFDEMLV